MSKCESCKNGRNRRMCKLCVDGDLFEEKAVTNYDRIKIMSLEEMAKFIGAIKCNTLSPECGYPACTSMKGKNCLQIKEYTNEDILTWLQKRNEFN